MAINRAPAADLDAPDDTGALAALFAQSRRSSERVICPVSTSALDESNNLSPAFYCVHSLSGAGGTDFRDLAKRMPDVRFYGIQAPPKKMHDADFGTSVEAIADHYAEALTRFQPDGPFMLGGWSAGAIIGLEIAQNLLARGREVALFAAIDAAPENTGVVLTPLHPFYWAKLACNVPVWIIHKDPSPKRVAQWLRRRASDTVTALSKVGKARGSGQPVVDRHTIDGLIDMSRFSPVQRSFMKRLYDAVLEYTPKTYPGDVVVYEATVKPLLLLPQVGKIWHQLATQLTIVDIAGDHTSILRGAYVNALAEDLRKRIVGSTTTLRDTMPSAARRSHGRGLTYSARSP